MVDEIIEIILVSIRRQSLSANPLNLVPLVNPLGVDHLLPGPVVPVVGQQGLGLLVHVPVLDVDEGGGSLQVLEVDVVEDPGVDDDVVLHVVHRETAVDDLPLGDGHPVVVHLGLGELLVHKQRLGSFPQHQLEFAQSAPPDPAISGLQLRHPLVKEVWEVGGDGQEDGLRRNLHS